MSVFPDGNNVKEYVRTLEQKVADLEEENELLEQENQLLRKRLERARAGGGGSSKRRERPDADPATTTLTGLNKQGESLRAAAAKAGIRTKDNDWRAPNLNQPSVGHDTRPPESPDSHTRRRQANPGGQLASQTMGRPLKPNEYDSPEPSTPSDGAPAIDMGYVNRVGAEELDELPYGLVVLDRSGDILFYNETESRYAGYKPEHVVGKNFFQEVAPCTRVKEFEGRFQKFVDGELGRVTFFDFAFHFEGGTQDVTIGLSQGRKNGQVNVMMMRR